jgi:hypothetical protein
MIPALGPQISTASRAFKGRAFTSSSAASSPGQGDGRRETDDRILVIVASVVRRQQERGPSFQGPRCRGRPGDHPPPEDGRMEWSRSSQRGSQRGILMSSTSHRTLGRPPALAGRLPPAGREPPRSRNWRTFWLRPDPRLTTIVARGLGIPPVGTLSQQSR